MKLSGDAKMSSGAKFFCVRRSCGTCAWLGGEQAMHFRSLVGISRLTRNMACAFY